MTTSANPAFANYSPRTQVIAHVTLKTAQAATMVVPPAWLVYNVVRRRAFSVRRFMMTSTNSAVVGALLGTGMGYLRLRNEPDAAIVDRTERLKHNASQVATDDYSIIGSALGALLAPALFLKRAPLALLFAGGGAIGLGAGVWAHLAQSLSKGKEIKPEGMATELPGKK